MSAAGLFLIMFCSLLCIFTAWAILECMALRRLRNQKPTYDLQIDMNHLSVKRLSQVEILPIWGNLKEELLIQEQGAATETNINKLRQKLLD